MNLENSIEYVKGIGTERAKLIKNVLGITTVEGLLNFYPIRYVDRSKTYTVRELKEDLPEIQLKGKISQLQEVKTGRNRRLTAKFQDETGIIDLVWFQYSQWLKEQIPQNKDVFIFGKVNLFNQSFSMSHPEIEVEEKKDKEIRLRPIYPSSEKLTKEVSIKDFFKIF